MKNFACWKSDGAYAIVNPDADAVPDHIFRAVHTDVRFQMRSRPDAPGEMIDPESFLRRFLAPRDHVLVPVVGESGTGKSHLIRWMQLRLPSNDQREVIFVPKAQTNLRDIVRALVKQLPETEQAQFTAELRGADSVLHGKIPQRTALLNHLQLALANDKGDATSGIDAELEQYLLDGLRAVLLDPYLRKENFLSDRGFAAELAEHVFERPDRYRPTEQRRLFTLSDLPLDVRGIQKAATATQDFLTYLVAAEDSIKESAAAIVNRNLDWAIARCLNISGDRLIDLMLGIRRRLKAEGKSLVLLIEDFARLQGLDRALLQSLIEQRSDLCVLRTAFASTTGFYDTIAKTVLTRLTFVIDMALPLGTEGHGIDLDRFTARYMNALRLGEAALKEGLQGAKQADGIFSVENHCDTCSNKSECHATFGEADGFGLYPFTRQALQLMWERANSDSRQGFNPREFQKAVLRPVALAAPDLEAGRFPPPGLLASLGGVRRLTPAEQNRLRSADPTNYSRRVALLELWDGQGQARDLAPYLHEAFGLATIGLSRSQSTTQELPPTVRSPRAPQSDRRPTAERSDDRVAELTNWFNDQRSLSATTAGRLRPLVFKAIDEAIDWDGEGLAQTSFRATAGGAGSRPFIPSSIYFLKQATNRVPNIVQIDVPRNWDDKDDRFRTVMALQGLIEADRIGSWDFEGAVEKLACLQECLMDWGKNVVQQIRQADSPAPGWDPADCAFALRVAAALLTTEGVLTRSDIDVVQTGLGLMGPPPTFATEALSTLVQEMCAQSDYLLEIINARRSAMKGGSPGNFMDTSALLRAVGPLRKNGFLPPPPPDRVTNSLDRLAALARRVAAQLPRLIQEEQADRRRWLMEMDASFGENTSKQTILSITEELINELAKMAVSGTTDLGNARHAFQDSLYDEALQSVRSLPESASARLADIARGIGTDMMKSRRLVTTLSTALARAESQVTVLMRNSGIEPGVDKQIVDNIATDLSRVESILNPADNA